MYISLNKKSLLRNAAGPGGEVDFTGARRVAFLGTQYEVTDCLYSSRKRKCIHSSAFVYSGEADYKEAGCVVVACTNSRVRTDVLKALEPPSFFL